MIYIALYKICSICNKKIDYGKKCECEIERKKDRYKTYAKARQDKDIQKIYSSKRWEQVRELVSVQQRGLDLYSYYIEGKVIQAETYHHIIEVKEDITRAYDVDNIIGLTQANHMFIHSAYNKSDKDKKDMQELLYSLLKRWKEEFGG